MTVRDIQNLQKPKSAVPVVKRVHEYLGAMRRLNKPVSRVVLARKDYDTILKSVVANKQPHEADITGLRFDGVPVERGGL